MNSQKKKNQMKIVPLKYWLFLTLATVAEL